MGDLKTAKRLPFHGKSILVVDDDIAVRDSLVTNLKEVGFVIHVADDGLSAKNSISLNNPDIILSDIRMPAMSGVELLQFVKSVSKIPLVLMTGFSEVMEAKDAFKLGADHFLSKPFSTKELFDILDEVLHTRGTQHKEHAAEVPYCRIPIDDFTSSSKLKVDIYVKLSEQKYIRVAKQSFELSADRLSHFKAKGLDFFYIRKQDFTKYLGLNLKVCKVIGDAENVTKQQKFHVLKHTAEILLQDTYVNGLNKNKFSTAKEVVDLTLDAMSEDEDLVSFLEMLNSNADFLYAHSLGVSLYSSLIAEEVGWNASATKFKISMGALLHDIGKKEIDGYILEKPRRDLNRHELQILESHSTRGRDILSQIPSIPPEVALIALQHHENCLGRGFPSGLSKDQINPLARLVSVANRFCELALKSPVWTPVSPTDAIDRILSLNENEYDTLALVGLMKIFDHPRLLDYERKLETEKLKTA